jgi:hypothetical protein
MTRSAVRRRRAGHTAHVTAVSAEVRRDHMSTRLRGHDAPEQT